MRVPCNLLSLMAKNKTRPGSGRSLWKLSVSAACEAEETLTEWLGGAFAVPLSSYTDFESRRTTVTLWFERKPDSSSLRRAEFRAALARLRQFGVHGNPVRLSLSRVRREDWAHSWKRHFPPIQVGAGLLIRPSWSRLRPRRGQALVVLDPGLSFGTGKHPTTAFCLSQLASYRAAVPPPHGPPAGRSFLDLGTGSGILAIAAAKLGYAPVEAHEIDPEALRIARANARRNGVSRKISFVEQDVARLPRHSRRKFDVVCANLTSDLLVAQRRRILSCLESGGLLVLAGVLETEFAIVRRAFEAEDLHLVTSRVRGEWRSGSFICPQN
jgi:ribosomal protein L11 methyltransferase